MKKLFVLSLVASFMLPISADAMQMARANRKNPEAQKAMLSMEVFIGAAEKCEAHDKDKLMRLKKLARRAYKNMNYAPIAAKHKEQYDAYVEQMMAAQDVCGNINGHLDGYLKSMSGRKR